ncbi:ferric reductase-like transmembrane domain-containing protein, partial [Eggerthella lenta]|nr:ferric reductase-like transmembrane domain-containing protein [Eggerthella lenta]
MVLVFALKKPVKRFPVLFYGIAVLLDVLFICNAFVPFPRVVSSALLLLIHKCTLSLALFVVVMYVGVFAQGSKAKTYLLPIRAELSIIAWILSLGHMAVYLMSYVPQVSHSVEHMSGATLGALAVALVLFALLLVLGVTSFNFVKKRMRKESWKRVQMLAYPFFLLVYAHLLLMLLPAALKGGLAAQASVAVYSAVFVGYVSLRLYRAAKGEPKPSSHRHHGRAVRSLSLFLRCP